MRETDDALRAAQVGAGVSTRTAAEEERARPSRVVGSEGLCGAEYDEDEEAGCGAWDEEG